MTAEELLAAIRRLPSSPGIYRMLGAGAEVLYVGKAHDLRRRVQSYFGRRGLSPRVAVMVRQVCSVDVTVTHTETEALLLENNLIKALRPRYNILLRDDKSYPYIYVSEGQPFPRLGVHRGAKRAPGRYFGPYPSATAVHESVGLLQKIFRVRSCRDSFFENRSRPCLQYQIGRCTAPCVGLVGKEDYAEDVRHTLMFLDGRRQTVIAELVQGMERAAVEHRYEDAAAYRDQIAALKRMQEHQYVSGSGGDADAVAVAAEGDVACVDVASIRGGLNMGSKSFVLRLGAGEDAAEALAAFLPQYYLSGSGTAAKPIPPRLYLGRAVRGRALLERAFSASGARKVAILTPTRGAPRRWIEMARVNAADALRRWLAGRADLRRRLEALRGALGLASLPQRIECFDVSHTMGEATVASCVVFDGRGAVTSDYRRYNIDGVAAGDDYGALTQALTRRFRRAKEGEGTLPDVLLIDGGKGQLAAAESVLRHVNITGIRLVGVAKGRERRRGRERLFLSGVSRPTILPPDSPALHLIEQVRDEAHRFAIAGHRQRRGRARTASVLERIPGIGGKRRQALLKNLGGLREVARSGVEDLARVPGISPALARRVYDAFHG